MVNVIGNISEHLFEPIVIQVFVFEAAIAFSENHGQVLQA